MAAAALLAAAVAAMPADCPSLADLSDAPAPHAGLREALAPCDLPVDPSWPPPQSEPWVATAPSGGFASAAFRRAAEPGALAARLGSREVLLSSANTFSYGRRAATLGAYLAELSDPQGPAAWAAAGGGAEGGQGAANASAGGLYYWFGEHGDGWEDLLAAYDPAPLLALLDPSGPWPARAPALSFGVGAHLSGVPFHLHGAGFSETLHGEKAWLFAREEPPCFLPNATSAFWAARVLPRLSPSQRARVRLCAVPAGRAVFFPEGWYHATLNTPGAGQAAVFMSTFL